jgi:uncharacterized protein YvpB
MAFVATVAAVAPVVVPLPVRAGGGASISATPVRQTHPLDCEAAALEIALRAVGISVSQDWILSTMGADRRPPVTSGGRPVQWGDPYQSFVGDWNGRMMTTGYGVYYPPVAAAAEAAGATAIGREGWSPAQLYAEVALGHPVVVWAPHLMAAPSVAQWTTWSGRSVWSSPQEHTQVLVGYDHDAATVTLANPADGQLHSYSMSLFENRFAAFMSSAVVIAPGGIHLAALDPATPANFAIAVSDNRIQALRPGPASFGSPQTWSTTPFYGSRATLFASVEGPGHGQSAVAVNEESVFVMRNSGSALGPAEKWSSAPFYGNLATLAADVDGTGFASLVAINDSSIWVMRNRAGQGFEAPQRWSTAPFYGTRGTFMAVVDGSGRASAVAVNDGNIWVMSNNGLPAASFAAPQLRASTAFYGTRGTFMADIDGHGRASAVAIDDSSIWVEANDGAGSFAAPQAWSTQPFYGTWQYMADVDGSGRASAIAVTWGATWVARNTGTAFGPPTRWYGAPFYGPR